LKKLNRKFGLIFAAHLLVISTVEDTPFLMGASPFELVFEDRSQPSPFAVAL
jgi:hypothetical protein